ncbi:MAG TPA: hypothetical protein VMX75_15120 [Spirochaetia bacterium]|nr:hypothetical protein [Spirochaetia bacterium]
MEIAYCPEFHDRSLVAEGWKSWKLVPLLEKELQTGVHHHRVIEVSAGILSNALSYLVFLICIASLLWALCGSWRGHCVSYAIAGRVLSGPVIPPCFNHYY